MAKFTVDFGAVLDANALAQIVGAPEALIREMLADDETLFNKHRVPKRSGTGYREFLAVIDEPLADALKALERRLADFLVERIPGFPHRNCHGYVKERSIYTNAQLHLRSRVLVRGDIRDFFPSITVGRVTNLFIDLKVPRSTADLLSRFVTYAGTLPLGFCTSPVIANAICFALDTDLTALADGLGYRYSRYSDDLTFSGNAAPPSRIEIASVVEKHGFQLNGRKFRTKFRGQSFYVTGLSVSDPERPRAPRKFKRGLRQELYYAKKFGLLEHLGRKNYASFKSGINQLDGRIRFLNAIEPALSKRLLDQWNDVLKDADEEPIQVARRDQAPREVSLFFDESIIDTPNGQVFFLGCLVTQDTDAIRGQLSDILGSIIADPFATGVKATLEQKGLHWVDVSEDTRSQVVKTISLMPIRVYVAYSQYDGSESFRQIYTRLLGPMLRPRFIALDGCTLNMSFEEHTDLRHEILLGQVTDVYEELTKRNGRRPRELPTVSVVSKLGEPCLSVIDFALGVLGQYASIEAKPPQAGKKTQVGELATKRFERLRAKFRVIRSEISAVVYTRRRPFMPWTKGVAT
jgi:RNA-directed DNA polymerase